jgi:hypothetical protein
MQWKPSEKWAARLGAFCTALLLGASAVYWVLHWPAPYTSIADGVPLASQPAAPAADLSAVAGLLGARQLVASPAKSDAPVSSTSRFKLIGVVARSSGQGSAIIAVDGLAAKSYRVGNLVADGWMLKSVAPRRAMLASGTDDGATQMLEIPAPPAPN